MNSRKKTWLWLAIYAISMAALEAAVVVYLRELYYGNNAALFPMREMAKSLALVELARELATLMMLVAVGVLCGKNAWSRLGYFAAAFGIWDIFYYVFLFVFIQWPASVLDWDILFLIPVPWFGPVLAPCLVSVALIILGFITSFYEKKEHALPMKWEEASTMLIGCAVILYTFMQDSLVKISAAETISSDLISPLYAFVPEKYPWGWFTAGFGILLVGLLVYYRRIRLSNQVLY